MTRMTLSQRLFGDVLIPLSYYIKGDFRYSHYRKYRKNIHRSRQQIKSQQLRKLRKLVLHAYDTTDYYRELLDNSGIRPGDIKTIEDFRKIPPLGKRVVLSNIDRLKSSGRYRLIPLFSGGSTGNKVKIYKDKRYHEMSYGAWLRDFYMIGIRPGYRSAWIWGNEFRHKPMLRRMFNWLSFRINRRILFDVNRYTDDQVVEWFETKFNRFRPDFIYGYAGIIYDMAKIIKERKIKVAPVKKIITTSERLENREFIEKVFGCKVLDHYGSTEVTTIAIEDDDYIMHSSDDFVFVELDTDGEILLTPLESYGMPLIRYRCGDIGMKSLQKESRKRTPFGSFQIKVGRTYEILLNKDGEKVTGGLIKFRIEKEDLAIREFQLVQKSMDQVELNIVLDVFTIKKAVQRLAEIVQEVLGCTRVDVNYMKKFPVEPNGKRIAFKCEIKDRVPG